MTYGQAYLSGWKETFNFSGRVQPTAVLDVFSYQSTDRQRAAGRLVSGNPPRPSLRHPQFCGHTLCGAVAAIDGDPPLLAVGCRRMHDIGRSGIWFVLGGYHSVVCGYFAGSVLPAFSAGTVSLR